MKREFLQNFKVGDQPLPKEVIDAIMVENGRDIEAAKANAGGNGGSDGKMFTQEEVNRIISDRLTREREKFAQQPQEDEREKALKAREARLDCRDYLDNKKYPAALLDVLDSSDAERFKTAADLLVKQFPSIAAADQMPPPYSPGTGSSSVGFGNDPLAVAFRPSML